MTFTVQFTRYFEELGFEDCDTKEFDNLKDAWDFYNENKGDSRVQLWARENGKVSGFQIA